MIFEYEYVFIIRSPYEITQFYLKSELKLLSNTSLLLKTKEKYLGLNDNEV